jgi:hypothetical protein
LAFGTKTTLLVNMLFAAQYKSWEGFFTVDPLLKQWLMAGELLLLLVFLVIFLPSRNYSASDEPVTESEEIKSSITA